jgi:hypothetical protein
MIAYDRYEYVTKCPPLYNIMHMNKLIWPFVGADYGVSKNTTDDEIGPNTVTLSPFASLRVNSAKGLSRWAQRCFAALSMTGL